MASNVFGKPVTEGTRSERAATARKDPNAANKRDEAVAYVRQQKANFGNRVSTLCIFYNATGETLYYDQDHSWHGRVWDSYPMELQNGQWGAFLHISLAGTLMGSMAYVTYRLAGFCSCLISWETPFNYPLRDTHVFCRLVGDGNIVNNDAIYNNMIDTGREIGVSGLGLFMTATIESDRSPLFEAHFNLDDS